METQLQNYPKNPLDPNQEPNLLKQKQKNLVKGLVDLRWVFVGFENLDLGQMKLLNLDL
ncbi:hypothetical protein HanRHA438_Chr15g0700171 [Helianthus annuus]|nr:hypothetical protein HanRHA438_Chr15g0700171 [Helianthus annuus]